MADVPVKISDLDRSYSLSSSPVYFLINQRNEVGNYETCALPLSVITNAIKEESKKELSNFIEVGTIIPYAGNILGQESIKGWLLCNGQQVRKKDYESLWSIIGDTYGPSDNNTFTLPDLRGRVEMGYSHTEVSYEPNFGNWLSGEKIFLGEGNNANYPDRGEYSFLLKNEHIRDHIHYAPPHKHKILNYVNILDYTPNKQECGFIWKGCIKVSENWKTLIGRGPGQGVAESIIFNAGGFGVGLICSTNYSKTLEYRTNFKSYNPSWTAAIRKFVNAHPIRTIFVYKKQVIDEIKNRKLKIPKIDPTFDSFTKISNVKYKVGGDNFHNNIQPNITTNFLIKY